MGWVLRAPHFHNTIPYRLQPTNPYAATKAGAEFIAKSYSRSFNLPLIITRGNNVYGPHQYPEKLVPKFVNLLMRDRPVTLHGNGLNTRNFLYVRVVFHLFLLLRSPLPFSLSRSVCEKTRVLACSREWLCLSACPQSSHRPICLSPFLAHPSSSLNPSLTPTLLSHQVEDVARAFEVILHRGMAGKIYNIGGTNEKANIEVAKDLIRLMGHEKAEEKMLHFVEDRAFNGTLFGCNRLAVTLFFTLFLLSFVVFCSRDVVNPPLLMLSLSSLFVRTLGGQDLVLVLDLG